MLDFFRDISGPITMHLELTEACPERCRHCYNFVRDASYRPQSISRQDINRILDDFKANGGFHVILTGGEPLLVFDTLLYAIEGVLKRGLTVSLNSNLMLAKPEKMKRLKDAGIDHILTTLFSHDPATHDFIASRDGAHKEILKGIEATRQAGIRVSVNMIVTNVNCQHVYATGKLLKEKGFEKFIANRMIPSSMNDNTLKQEFLIGEKTAGKMLDDLLRLEKEFGMTISSCRALPHCFLGNLDKYAPFTARGCNAGKRHLLVHVDGTARACVHEAATYGNVHEIGIKGVWQNMRQWRKKELLPEGCRACPVVDICEGACRQIGEVVYGDWSQKDNLCQGPEGQQKYHRGVTEALLAKIKDLKFSVNPAIEFRAEDEFYVVRIFGAKCVLIEKAFGDFLIDRQKKGAAFSLADFPNQHAEELGLYLLYEIVTAEGLESIDGLLTQYKK